MAALSTFRATLAGFVRFLATGHGLRDVSPAEPSVLHPTDGPPSRRGQPRYRVPPTDRLAAGAEPGSWAAIVDEAQALRRAS
jgi:hypothetical protein